MVTNHPTFRLGAPVSGPHGEFPVEYAHELIAELRAIRVEGNEALAAIERFDPDLSVKLSTCTDEKDAQSLLDEWLRRRVDALEGTHKRLLEVWRHGRHAARAALTPDSQSA